MEKFPTTLIIGLGGVGSKITTRIYQQFLASKPAAIEQRNLVCLCFDTDGGDIERYKKVLPKEWVVKTSTDLSCTVGGYINDIKDKTTVLDWFDTRSREVLNMSLNEGAGQIRMASRLAYMAAMGEGKLNAIDGALRNLLIQEPERHDGNDVKVHIISSLGGGTGAGSFLQTAYYIKETMRNEHGINNPQITGYFVLADILCSDRTLGFQETQKENVRSNTYACIKELNAFIHKDKIQVLKPIGFEYKFGQTDLRLPHAKPYNQCYLIDFTTAEGQNLNSSQQYYDQLGDYVYLNAFTDIGTSARSKAINDIRQKVENAGNGAYSAIGVSKLVYPVEDLFGYFATQRVVDNLNETWVTIDNEFKKVLEAYNEKIQSGGTGIEPDRSLYFRSNVEQLATKGSGFQKTEFSAVYNSVWNLDKEGHRVNKKSLTYLDAVEAYVEQVAMDEKLQRDYEKVKGGMDNFLEEDDEANDVESITEREQNLERLKKYAKTHIEQVLPQTIKECFMKDYDEATRVSMNPEATKHHLNTFILQKDHEMHPLAVRYFLYEVKEGIQTKLASLKEENESLLKKIDELYQNNFNVIDDKNDIDDEYKENAQEKMAFVYRHNKAFIKRAWQKITGKSPIRQCKEDYLSFSGIQRENIVKFAKDKLLENVYNGLLLQIDELISESERFFDRLPDTLRGLKTESDSLLKKHDDVSEPSITYVLAKSRIMKDLYDEVICANNTPFFPTEMSAQIYRTLYENTYNTFQHANKKKRELTKEEAERLSAEQLEADMKVFEQVRKLQEQTLRVKNNALSEMNVIQALREEAKRESSQGKEFAYMKEVFANLTKKAVIRGTTVFDTKVNRPINSWGLNPACLDNAVISKKEKNDLFGETDITTEPLKAATIEEMKYFSKYEIVRTNSIHLLEVDKNFPAFFETSTTEYVEGKKGSYYVAYENLINRILNGSDAYSPHLDKNWHLPSYMPNIGKSMDGTMNKIFKALFYGLLLGKLKSKDDGGMDYWYAIGTKSYYIRDLKDSPIKMKGNNITTALNKLFEFGLADNPKLVDKLLEYADKAWDDALTKWNNEDNKTLEKMKANPMVKRILDFRFAKVYGASNWSSAKFNFAHILNDSSSSSGLLSKNIANFKPVLFKEIIDKMIEVFGSSENTRLLCQYVFNGIKDNMLKEEALAFLEQEEENNRFEK